MNESRNSTLQVQSTAKPVRLSRAQRTAILKALADPHRFELMERVAGASCPLGCSEMRTALKISAATLSHHVKELDAAGLVKVEREGKYMYLSPRCEVWAALIESLTAIGKKRRAQA